MFLIFFLDNFTVEMEGTCHLGCTYDCVPEWVAILLFFLKMSEVE